MSRQTDFSKVESDTELIRSYEKYAEGVDRLNSALNVELAACHRCIDQLKQQITANLQQTREDQIKMDAQQGEIDALQQRADALAWFQQSLFQLLQRIETRLVHSKRGSRISRESVIMEEDTIMDGLTEEPDPVLSSLRTSIVDSRLVLPDPALERLLERLLMLLQTMMSKSPMNSSGVREHEVEVLINKIIELETDKTQLLGRANSAEKQLETQRASMGQLEEKLHEQQEQSTYLRAELDNAEKTVGELRQHISELQVGEYGVIADGDIDERDELMDRLEQQYKQKEQLYEFIQELKATVQELNRSIEKNKQVEKPKDSKVQSNRLNAEIARLKKQNGDLNNTLIKVQKKRSDLQEEATTLRKEKEQDRKELVQINQRLKQQEQRALNAERELEQLRNRLKAQHSSAMVSAEALNMSDEGRYVRPTAKMIAKTPDQSATNPQKENNEQRGGCPTLDTSRWIRLHERLDYRKHYAQDLSQQNVSFKMLKLRN